MSIYKKKWEEIKAEVKRIEEKIVDEVAGLGEAVEDWEHDLLFHVKGIFGETLKEEEFKDELMMQSKDDIDTVHATVIGNSPYAANATSFPAEIKIEYVEDSGEEKKEEGK